MISHWGLWPGTTSREYLVRNGKGWKGRYLPTSSARCLPFPNLRKRPLTRSQVPEGGDAGEWRLEETLRLPLGL